MDPGGNDKTFILPSADVQRSVLSQPTPVNKLNAADLSFGNLDNLTSNWSNPLISSASSLLSLVSKLRNLAFHDRVDELQMRLVREMTAFENHALQKGATEKEIMAGRYFICSLIDETVMNTPWGNQSNWSQQSLLSRFYTESWGGENFFQLLEKMKQQPSQHLSLLELAYLCLSMGFEGKYRVSNDREGLRIIERLRHELYDIINRTRGESKGDLSIKWKGLSDLRSPLRRYVPLWMLAIVTGSLLIILYLGFVFAANRASDNVYGQLMALIQNKIEPPSPRSFLLEPSSVPPAPEPGIDLTARFRRLLASEIVQNMVEVIDGPVLRISNAFLSGSEKVKSDYRPMLVRIAKELETGSNRIQVIGHTDNQPIKFSARFKSNWHLSVARAENIASIISASPVLKGRIIAEGRSDGDPIVKNDTAENRARNRRVDIHIW